MTEGFSPHRDKPVLSPEVLAMIERIRKGERPALVPVNFDRKRDRTVYGCCGAKRRTPHKPTCPNVGQKTPTKAKKRGREFLPPAGSWVKMHRLAGVWSAALVLPDGRTSEAEDQDWHRALEMLGIRIQETDRDYA